MNESAGSSLRVFPDVVVHELHADQWIAISWEAAVIGETLVLDLTLLEGEGQLRERFPVYVIDSQPVVIDGDVRHRIRLQGSSDTPILFEQQVRRG